MVERVTGMENKEKQKLILAVLSGDRLRGRHQRADRKRFFRHCAQLLRRFLPQEKRDSHDRNGLLQVRSGSGNTEGKRPASGSRPPTKTCPPRAVNRWPCCLLCGKRKTPAASRCSSWIWTALRSCSGGRERRRDNV